MKIGVVTRSSESLRASFAMSLRLAHNFFSEFQDLSREGNHAKTQLFPTEVVSTDESPAH